ncbi:DNA-binding protein [Gloeothece verrucosa]|uniref:Uncharacterized protein n=1 Tax=Gloeothece verrucosa (strain PCC 7822) TaxID=497965 RepID=E0UKB7_GLOV7|nr:DNA-binding protein [Gloeothece verrucosa]ADN15879.1 conserved hypothetical protein [Gloeothece verrucosa PCC 7822]
MSNLTIQIPDEKLDQLEELARAQGLTLEQLLIAKIDDWLTENPPDFNQAVNYVLTKNTELYKRLA